MRVVAVVLAAVASLGLCQAFLAPLQPQSTQLSSMLSQPVRTNRWSSYDLSWLSYILDMSGATDWWYRADVVAWMGGHLVSEPVVVLQPWRQR